MKEKERKEKENNVMGRNGTKESRTKEENKEKERNRDMEKKMQTAFSAFRLVFTLTVLDMIVALQGCTNDLYTIICTLTLLALYQQTR